MKICDANATQMRRKQTDAFDGLMGLATRVAG